MDQFERIRNVVAEALAVDPDDIKHETNLLRDLGAESIDLLDVIFRLEKEFDIRLPRGEIERRTRGTMTDAEFIQDGCLSAAALAQLRTVMPEVPASEFAPGLRLRDLPQLMTVASLERIVSEQLLDDATANSASRSRPEATAHEARG